MPEQSTLSPNERQLSAALELDPPGTPTRRVPPGVLVFVAALVSVHLLGLSLHPFTGKAHALFSDTMQNASGLFAALAAFVASRRLGGRQRWVWLMVGCAILVNEAANIGGDILTVLDAHGNNFLGNFLQFFPIVAFPFAIVGTAALVSTYIRVSRLRTTFDAFIATAAVFMVAWVLLLKTIVHGSGGDPSDILPPMADVLYAVLIMFVAVRARREFRAPLLLIIAGQLCNTLTDVVLSFLHIQGHYVTGSLLEVGWTISFVLIGMAALYARPIPEDMRNNQPVTQLVFAIVPYLAVCIGAIAATYAEITQGHMDGFLTWTSITLMILLSVRQYLALRENQRLTDTLEMRSQALRENEERFRKLVSHSSDIIAVVDREGTIRYITPAVERLLQLQVTDMLDRPLVDFVHPADAKSLTHHLMRVSGSKRDRVKTLVFRIRDGSMGWHVFEATSTNMLNEDGVRGIVLNTRDITERHALESELRYQAFHDPLTHLANRALLHDRLTHAVDRQARHQEEVALILVDLDDFKEVNDTWGHAAGDEVLCEIARRMIQCLRESDTGSRLGGDEFALLLEGGDTKLPIAEVTQRVLRSIEQPLRIDGSEVIIRASAGITISEGGVSAGDLMRQADAAMYQAKARGKGQYAIFSDSPLAPAQPLRKPPVKPGAVVGTGRRRSTRT